MPLGIPAAQANIVEAAIALGRERSGGGRPALVGLAGAQGSGKSTLARGHAAAHPDVACLSLDDFYLDSAARARLAATVHPLLATRGVPGTHDVAGLAATIAALGDAGPADETPIPVFDKLADDPLPRGRWHRYRGRSSVILVEGWCLGALPQDRSALAEPVNALERTRDPEGVWRRYVNGQLEGAYAALFAGFHALAYLRPPDFGQVVEWRREQQETLLGRALARDEAEVVAGFVAFFERITRHMMAGGIAADIVDVLRADRSVAERLGRKRG